MFESKQGAGEGVASRLDTVAPTQVQKRRI